MGLLEGSVALVTGASRGIGRAVAERLAAQGARLALVGRSHEVADVAEALRAAGHEALAFVGDVTSEERVHGVVAHVLEELGGIDLLVNNAGVGFFKPVEEITADEWRHLFEVNVTGTFLFCRAVVPHLKAARRGTIVNVSSDAARRTFAHGTAYVASKYAVQGFSGCLAQELRPFGVRVATINPGLVDTYFNGGRPGMPDRAAWLRPEDVADAVVYVATAPPSMVVDSVTLHPLAQEYGLA